jgi:hypothetical protein
VLTTRGGLRAGVDHPRRPTGHPGTDRGDVELGHAVEPTDSICSHVEPENRRMLSVWLDGRGVRPTPPPSTTRRCASCAPR